MKINILNQGSKWKELLKKGFDSKRLRLSAFVESDFSDMRRISRDKDLYTFVHDINNGNEAESWLRSVYLNHNYLFFSIRIKPDNTAPVAGIIGILMLNLNYGGKIEIGGWIGKEFQKKGYATELVEGLVSFVKKQDKSLSLYAEIMEENISAKRCTKILGRV